jgi:hypothetical protein
VAVAHLLLLVRLMLEVTVAQAVAEVLEREQRNRVVLETLRPNLRHKEIMEVLATQVAITGVAVEAEALVQ